MTAKMINHKIEEVAIVAKIMIIVMNYWWLWWLLHTQWTCQSGHNSLDCSAWNILHDENLQKMKLMMNFSMTRWWISRCLPRPSWCMGTLRGSRGKPPRLVVVILLRKNLTTRYILSLPRYKVKVFSQNFPWDWKLAGNNSFFCLFSVNYATDNNSHLDHPQFT